MFTTFYSHYDSPIGRLTLTGSAEALTGLYLPNHKDNGGAVLPQWRLDDTRFCTAKTQLDEYFAGQRQQFTLPLARMGTEFQQQVWAALRQIPYGQTISYGQLAQQIGNPAAVRAVGMANGSNPISIIVPCHRVIGANGKLTGYAGGLDRKDYLLGHERQHSTLASQGPAEQGVLW